MEKVLVLGECKWGTQSIGRSVLTDLIDKTSDIVPANGNWQVYYLGFARDGWTEQSLALAQELTTTQPTGKNWRVIGMKLLDLSQVDLDLGAWIVL